MAAKTRKDKWNIGIHILLYKQLDLAKLDIYIFYWQGCINSTFPEYEEYMIFVLIDTNTDTEMSNLLST